MERQPTPTSEGPPRGRLLRRPAPRLLALEAHRGAAGPRLRFATATVAAATAFGLVYAAFVLTELGQRAENLALLGAELRSEADRAASLGRLSLISVVSFGLGILLVFLAATMRRRAKLGIAVAAVMAGSIVAAELLKELLPRPGLVAGPAWILRNDFPSGHSTIAAAVAVGILLVAPDRLRWLVLPAGALAAGFIGHATQVAGWHRMSGSLGGLLLVLTAAAGALLVLAQAGLVRPSLRGRVSPRVTTLLVAIGSLLVLLGAVVLAIFVGFPLLSAPEGASSAFLHTALDALGAGVTVLAFVAFAAAIEPFALGQGDEPKPPEVPEPTARPERDA